VVDAPSLSVFKRHWTMPLTICFKFCSALNWLGSWTRWLLEVPSSWQSILFYSNHTIHSWKF